VSGIGSVYAGRLEADGIETLDQLADAEPQRIAEVLGVSEVRAMSFVDEARRLREQ
jgi:predicted flap endonuclease-1-like 5' DNA nuclease